MDEIHSAWSLKDGVWKQRTSVPKMVMEPETCAGQSMVHQKHFMIEMVKTKLPNGIFINFIKQISDDVSV